MEVILYGCVHAKTILTYTVQFNFTSTYTGIDFQTIKLVSSSVDVCDRCTQFLFIFFFVCSTIECRK